VDDASDRPRAQRRADIQGLRAVAVLAVVAAHAGLPLPGGFAGVDVFFVVSGYVIGSLLLREASDGGTVRLRTFYGRRARRLLPALAVAVVASIAVAIVVLDPYEAQPTAFATSLWSSVFVANAYLYRHVGYFDAGLDTTNPFLHLWSLSVEEQFYLVLPLLLLVAWRIGGTDGRRRERWVRGVVGVSVVGSFVASVVLTTVDQLDWLEAPRRFAFFLAPTRFWELGAGILLATVVPATSASTVAAAGIEVPGAAGSRPVHLDARSWGAAAGALLLLGSFVLLDPLAPFPGLAAVPVVAGTVLLLAFGETTTIGRALAWRPITWLGDRSYSWYLWHWPAIVFAVALWPTSPSAPVVAAGLSLVPAALVHRTIEDPIRRATGVPALRTAAIAGGCTLAIVAASLVGLRGARAGWGVEQPTDWWERADARYSGCVLINRDLANEWPRDACTFGAAAGDGGGLVLVVGDSHGASMVEPMVELAEPRGVAVAGWFRAGCPASFAVPEHYPRCAEWQRLVLDQVRELQPELVVIANRSTDYTTDVPRAPAPLGRTAVAGGPVADSEADRIRTWAEGLGVFVAEVRALGPPVLVVGGPPTYRNEFPVPSVLRPDATPPEVPRRDIDDRHGPVVAAEVAALAALAEAGGVTYLDPVPLLCEADACRAQIDGRWTHQDAVDLNDPGARLLLPDLDDAWQALEAGR
jgi:peptidoglycan/LPS O-acetylase OafA/YrhL